MKTVTTTISVVLLLSTLIWVVIYREFPHQPLDPRETVLVVFVVTVATASCQALWRRFRNRKQEKADETHK